MHALLRRSRANSPSRDISSSTRLELDFSTGLVRLDRKIVSLTPAQNALLRILARHAGQILSAEQIIGALWEGDNAGNVRNLRVQISQLRRKVEIDPLNPTIVETVPRLGYRLNLLSLGEAKAKR